MKENSKYVLNVLNDAITMNVDWSFQDSKKNVKNSIKFVWQYIYIKKNISGSQQGGQGPLEGLGELPKDHKGDL